MGEKVKAFFKAIEEIWGAIPGYVKVFLFSVSSSTFGLWVTGQLDFKSVVIILATNIGIYQIPRTIGEQTKRLIK